MSKEFSVEQIQALMKSVSENHIGELQFETEGVKLKIKNWMMAPSAGEGSQPAAVLAGARSSSGRGGGSAGRGALPGEIR